MTVALHTNFGTIKIELDAANAPKTVDNFLSYVRSGFYNNTIFHRVIDGFMIQGGGFEPGMKQKKNQPADRKRSQQWTVQRNIFHRNGQNTRSAFRDRAIFHQRQQQ